MAAIPELQHPTITNLRPREIVACFQSNLWDEETSRMISYREAARVRQPAMHAEPDLFSADLLLVPATRRFAETSGRLDQAP